ncbi:MAG: chemotaxis protein CheA [Candidatus Omnitrophica bacterium]|nr:chemotaxis protein CheA [Candidatus Omnitrophota bacterium]
MITNRNYRELFFGESQEYLKEVNSALVNLEKNSKNYEAINTVFRLMHTLKGMAATMEYNELADLAHHLEDVFDAFRSKQIKISSKVMDIIFESIDAFALIVNDLREEKPISVQVDKYLDKLSKVYSREKETEIVEVEFPKSGIVEFDPGRINELKKQGKKVLHIKVVLVANCLLKGARAFLVLKRAEALGEVIKVSPAEELLKEDKFDISFELLMATEKNPEDIKKGLLKILEVEEVEVSPFENVLLEEEKKQFISLRKIQSMRIPVERLDKIMNIMGELSIVKSRLVQIVKNYDSVLLKDTTSFVERLISTLQDETLKMRLLPISYILDNFFRTVRDLTRKQNKEAELEITGSEIEVDRVVLDEIADPLLHLIRNAIDHGIETVEERKHLGKKVPAKIFIKVLREKGQIIIEISDDGRGIDFAKIIQSGIERRFVTREETLEFKARQVLDILTTPGFSTRKKVTKVSGRGVGLDVVKDKLDAFGGRLDLESKLGEGTKFILSLPLTLAIIKAMLVLVGEYTYAIPLMNIRETVKINNQDVKHIKNIEVIRIRDEIIPIFRLAKELNIDAQNSEDKEKTSIVIVEGRVKSVGLVVDKVIGEQDIVVKPLAAFVKKTKGIAGATILGDGRVALILDVLNIK